MNGMKEEEWLFSLDLIRKHSAGNEGLVIEFVQLFVSTSESILEQTAKAINKGELVEVARLMHKLGPGLHYLNMQHLGKRVKDLELAAKTGRESLLVTQIFSEIESVMRSCIGQLQTVIRPK